MELISKDDKDVEELRNLVTDLDEEKDEDKKETEETQEVRSKIQSTLQSEKTTKWLSSQPISSEYDIIRGISKDFNVNLTDAKKAIPQLPDEPLIGKKSLPSVIKDLRYLRRKLKGSPRIKLEKTIYHLITAYEDHVQKSLDSLYWLESYQSPLKRMSINERVLEKLNYIKDEPTRNEVINSLCKYWEADLDRKGLDYSKEYAVLSRKMKEGKKEFNKVMKSIAHQSLRRDRKEIIQDEVIKITCEYPGLESTTIAKMLPDKLKKRCSAQMVSKMLRTYGATMVDKRYYLFSDEIKKDIYSYVAGVIDSDGYITMDKSCSARVGIVATGDRGKAYLTELEKVLKIGKLHLDQPGYNETNRKTNRLNFYSMAHIEELLSKTLPHLRMKVPQANLVLEAIRIKQNYKKEEWAKPRLTEIFKIIKFENWKDAASTKELDKYDIKADDIVKYRTNCKMGVMDEMDSITKSSIAPPWTIRDLTQEIIDGWIEEGVQQFTRIELREEVEERFPQRFPQYKEKPIMWVVHIGHAITDARRQEKIEKTTAAGHTWNILR